MGRRFFEQTVMVLLFAVFGAFVLTVVSFLDFGQKGDMNYNEFFTPNVQKVYVATSAQVVMEFEADWTNLGENYTITRNVSMTTSISGQSIRAVYSKGDAHIPHVYEGRYFTQEEFDSDAAVCVVGRKIKELGDVFIGEDGKEYFYSHGKNYEVIGYIGTDKQTHLDNMVMLNMNCFNKDMNFFTSYYIDSKDKAKIPEITQNWLAQFKEEVEAGACKLTVVNREHTSVLDMGEATQMFMLAVGMVFINVLVSISQFVEKRAYSAAVKKLCGFSMTGVITELLANIFVSASLGFLIGIFVKNTVIGKALKLLDSSVEIPEAHGTAWIAYTFVLLFTLGVSFFTARKVFRQDTSSFLKIKE